MQSFIGVRCIVKVFLSFYTLRLCLVHLETVADKHVYCFYIVRLDSDMQERVAILIPIETESIHDELWMNWDRLTHFEEQAVRKNFRISFRFRRFCRFLVSNYCSGLCLDHPEPNVCLVYTVRIDKFPLIFHDFAELSYDHFMAAFYRAC